MSYWYLWWHNIYYFFEVKICVFTLFCCHLCRRYWQWKLDRSPMFLLINIFGSKTSLGQYFWLPLEGYFCFGNIVLLLSFKLDSFVSICRKEVRWEKLLSHFEVPSVTRRAEENTNSPFSDLNPNQRTSWIRKWSAHHHFFVLFHCEGNNICCEVVTATSYT